jgi:hypothetical protein
MVKLPKHGSLLLMKLLMELFLKNSSKAEAELCQTDPKYPVDMDLLAVVVEPLAVDVDLLAVIMEPLAMHVDPFAADVEPHAIVVDLLVLRWFGPPPPPSGSPCRRRREERLARRSRETTCVFTRAEKDAFFLFPSVLDQNRGKKNSGRQSSK